MHVPDYSNMSRLEMSVVLLIQMILCNHWVSCDTHYDVNILFCSDIPVLHQEHEYCHILMLCVLYYNLYIKCEIV